jgi:FdhD protein
VGPGPLGTIRPVPRSRTERVLTRRFADGHVSGRTPDELIVEEPLAIHVDGVQVSSTMRTPGHDFELAVGFCLTEGLLGPATVTGIRYCATGSAVDTDFNVVSVDTDGSAPPPTARLGSVSSSCGLCGSVAIDELTARLPPLPPVAAWDPAVLAAVPDQVRDAQPLFEATGAVHAAAAFDAAGQPYLLREDIGRHNAVDKVVGRLLLDHQLPATGSGLFVSGRASFEMVQKAWAAGFSALVSVSAPSALAVATARRSGLVLFGFVRGGAGNLYTDGTTP